MAANSQNSVIQFPIQAPKEALKGGRPPKKNIALSARSVPLEGSRRSKEPLDALTVKNAKYDPAKGGKIQKLSDQFGLYLALSPAGGKVWRMKYSFDGKSKDHTIGKYPLFSLTDARQARNEAKKQLAIGNDPGVLKKQTRGYDGLEDDSFKPYAEKWVKNSGGRDIAWSESTSVRILSRLNRFTFKDSQLGNQSIGSITTMQLVNLLQNCKKASTKDVAYRLQQDLISIFNQATRHGLCPNNPAAYMQKEIRKPKGGHFPSVTDPARVGEIMQIIYTDHPTVKPKFRTLSALRLLPYLFGRNLELRSMEWDEIDWTKGHWVIPAHKMKMRKIHGVPLPTQAIAILKDLKANAPNSKYVFMGYQTKAKTLSNMTINNCLKDLGVSSKELTPHGFRAMAQTLTAEQLDIPKHIIDLQLSHRPADDKYNGAYDRAEFWQHRVEAMQRYADYLDQLRSKAYSLD